MYHKTVVLAVEWRMIKGAGAEGTSWTVTTQVPVPRKGPDRWCRWGRKELGFNMVNILH